MWATFLPFLLLFALSLTQRCPSRGDVKKANPRNDCGYVQCHNGRGYWCDCPQGQYFVEEKQCCVRRSSKSSSSRSSGKSSSNSSSNGRKNHDSGGSSSENDSGSGNGNGGNSGGNAGWDYHWR